MTKLSASLVVDLVDKTGAKTQAIIGNMSRLQRAERDLALANSGTHLSRRDRALERVMMEREASLQERQQRISAWAARGGVAAAAIGVAAGRAYASFAETERRVNRIVLNADRGMEAIRPTMSTLQKVAADTRMSFADATEGLETLVASGRSLEDALTFLPSVAVTAQASGSAIGDVALSADAMAGSLKINAGEMQKAFDILVAGGKAGKFELKDMSQYLPSLLPAFSALGYKGTQGLQKVVAILQVMRNQAGSSSEAATYLGNVLNKMYSEETANKFADFGINIRKELDLAKASGRDVIDVFVELAAKATNGDLAKLPMLFTDSELQKGMRALITQRPELEALFQSLGNVDGTALKDVNQIFEDSASKIQQMSSLWEKFTNQIGSGLATAVNPVLEETTTAIDDYTAKTHGRRRFRDDEDYNNQRRAFEKRYRALNPDAWFTEVNTAFGDALAKLGREEAKSVFDAIELEEQRRGGGQRTARYPSRGTYDPAIVSEAGATAPRGGIPIPSVRPDGSTGLPPGAGYPSRGSYQAGMAAGGGGFAWLFDSDFWLGKAAKGGSLRDHMKMDVQGGALGGKGSGAAATGPQEVSLLGMPTVVTQPSGIQQVQVMNPPPAPQINLSVTVHATTNASPQEIGDQAANVIGQRVKAALSGAQADMEYSVG